MPNHVENDLTITGPKNELKRFKEFAKGPNPWDEEDIELLSCAKFIPVIPEAVKDYNNVGYNWCIENWGTKWGCYEIALSDYEDSLFYTFLTAWSPALPVVQKMREMFPKLAFDLRYYESGMGFHGVLRIENGEVTIDKESEYLGQRGG